MATVLYDELRTNGHVLSICFVFKSLFYFSFKKDGKLYNLKKIVDYAILINVKSKYSIHNHSRTNFDNTTSVLDFFIFFLKSSIEIFGYANSIQKNPFWKAAEKT